MAIININKRFRMIEQWKLKDAKLKPFTDGRLYIGEVKRDYSTGGKVTGEVWQRLQKLPYSIVSIREEDKQLAYQTNTRLDLKIRVPKNRFLNENQTVKVDADFYEIVRLDHGQSETYLFLRKRTKADPKLTEQEVQDE